MKKEFGGGMENDIRLVMEQTNCSYDRAKNALKNSNWDLVNAIFEIEEINSFSSQDPHYPYEYSPSKRRRRVCVYNNQFEPMYSYYEY